MGQMQLAIVLNHIPVTVVLKSPSDDILRLDLRWSYSAHDSPAQNWKPCAKSLTFTDIQIGQFLAMVPRDEQRMASRHGRMIKECNDI